MQTARYLATLFIFAALTGTNPASAADVTYLLAHKNGCFNCHRLETDDIGPAWKKVAARYRGDASAEATLVNKVTRGGKGVWGYLPMPAFASQLNETDIKALVKYILALK